MFMNLDLSHLQSLWKLPLHYSLAVTFFFHKCLTTIIELQEYFFKPVQYALIE